MDSDARWRVTVHPSVADDMAGFTQADKQMILRKISEKLTLAPLEFGKRLRGELHPLLRLRVGDYRIVYQASPLRPPCPYSAGRVAPLHLRRCAQAYCRKARTLTGRSTRRAFGHPYVTAKTRATVSVARTPPAPPVMSAPPVDRAALPRAAGHRPGRGAVPPAAPHRRC